MSGLKGGWGSTSHLYYDRGRDMNATIVLQNDHVFLEQPRSIFSNFRTQNGSNLLSTHPFSKFVISYGTVASVNIWNSDFES